MAQRINRKVPQVGKPQLTFQEMSRLFKARSREYSLKGLFKYGYRNKEDASNVPPMTLVVGSQNVLTNAAERVGIRQGYTLDGSAGNQNDYGIDSAYDFQTKLGTIQNLRKWGPNLELRYVNPSDSTVSWINILSTLVAANACSFTNFWDLNTEVSMFCLFANGDNNVYEWSGGVASVSSVTTNTITVQGMNTLAQLGFYNQSANAAKMKLLINGTTYTYTGIGGTTSNAYSQTPTTTKVAINNTTWVAQKFTTGANAQLITQATVDVNSAAGNSTTTNLKAYIYSDTSGSPGTLLGTATSSIAGAYSSGDFTVTFSFPSLSVTGNTNYHLIVEAETTSTDLSVYIGSTASVGTQKSTDSGSTWSSINGYLHATVTENDTANGLQTFTGVTPDPTGNAASGDAVIQAPAIGSTAAGVSGLPTTFNIDIISTLSNQVWYGSKTSTILYVSKTNNYKDCTYSSPQRLPAEGALLNLDGPLVALSPQGLQMYAACGRSQWWVSNTFQQTVVVSGVSTPTETLYMQRIKTAHNQAAQSNELVGRFKNSLVFVSNEQIINTLGLVKNVLGDPQVTNISDPIKYDIDAYDFTGGQVWYDNYFIYITVPQEGIVRMYNVNKKYWEAPQTIPISRFYYTTTEGSLFGHSSITNESYQLFTGYNDNGNPINAVAAFPYVSEEGGSPAEKKSFFKWFTEGYISANTTLTLTVNFEYGGFGGSVSKSISGANKSIIFNKITDGSLGANTLGTQPIGSILNLPNQSAVPKFRTVSTFPRKNFFEYQVVYSSNAVDQDWELLRIGGAIAAAPDIPVEVTD